MTTQPRETAVPRVRAVVLNFNGGSHVVSAVEALLATDWPADRLDVVVVDNASSDGSDGEILRRFDSVTLLPTGENLGFPANNVAMGAVEGLADPDYVALVNNDAFVAADWLAPLVDELESDAGLGAACPRIVFASDFIDVEILSDTFTPGRGDPRELGVRLQGVLVDGADAWRDAQRVDGFWGVEPGPDGDFEWTDGRARLRVPVPVGAEARPEVTVLLAADEVAPVELRSGAATVSAAVGPGATELCLTAESPAYPVINNVGSILIEGGYGADRGFLEPDDGRFDSPADVFAWCGGGVLLRRAYLEDVGLFDDRFFLYYEDTDLAWRGRGRGWRYRYVPGSVLRHIHAASSGEGSPLFQHYVERNRLAMLTKNAPATMAASAVGRYLLTTASYARRDVLAPVLHRHRPNLELVRRRLRSLLAYVRMLPALLARRRRIKQRQVVADDVLLDWMQPR